MQRNVRWYTRRLEDGTPDTSSGAEEQRDITSLQVIEGEVRYIGFFDNSDFEGRRRGGYHKFFNPTAAQLIEWIFGKEEAEMYEFILVETEPEIKDANLRQCKGEGMSEENLELIRNGHIIEILTPYECDIYDECDETGFFVQV